MRSSLSLQSRQDLRFYRSTYALHMQIIFFFVTILSSIVIGKKQQEPTPEEELCGAQKHVSFTTEVGPMKEITSPTLYFR